MKNKIGVGTKIEITCEDGILKKGSKHKIYYVSNAEPGSGSAWVEGEKGQYLIRYKGQNLIVGRDEFKVIK